MIKIVEFAWIIVAVISALEVIRLWNSGQIEFWYFVAGVAIGIFMFLFRRKQRLKMEQYQREKNEREQPE